MLAADTDLALGTLAEEGLLSGTGIFVADWSLTTMIGSGLTLFFGGLLACIFVGMTGSGLTLFFGGLLAGIFVADGSRTTMIGSGLTLFFGGGTRIG